MSIVIRAAKGDGEIMIYDGIGADFWGDGVTAKGFVADLKALGSLDTLTIRLNSGGGDVFDGIAIYEAIARSAAKKKVVCIDGLAASIASVIAMAGDEIKIAPAGFVMIHNAWSISVGDAARMRKAADLLDSVSAQMAGIYVSRTRAAAARVREWMNTETWFDAEAAIKNGFADCKTDDVVKVAASIDGSRFRNIPTPLRACMTGNVIRMDAMRHQPPATPRLDALRARMSAA